MNLLLAVLLAQATLPHAGVTVCQETYPATDAGVTLGQCAIALGVQSLPAGVQ
jgi:predicted hotdog family 3-hydroxylacyl-ACP dehydratase